MFSYVLNALRWRTSRGRVRRNADVLLRRHGDAALFRALDLLRQAERHADRRQVLFWQAVAHEAAHQVRRRAILETIMCPTPPEPNPQIPPVAAEMTTAIPARGGNGRIRLVHPAPAFPDHGGQRQPHERRTHGRLQERQRWRGTTPLRH